MNNKDYISWKESVQLLSFVLPVILVYVDHNLIFETLSFIISWIILILFISNIRRIPRTNKYLYSIRIMAYFLGYGIIGSYLYSRLDVTYRDSIFMQEHYAIIMATLVGAIYITFNKKAFIFMLSDINIADIKKMESSKYFLYIFNQIGAAVCEEIYFRKFLMTLFMPLGLLSTIISMIYFFLSHYLLPWNQDFTKKDYINQLSIGFISAVLFYLSKSVIPCVILHLIANMPSVILQIKSYIRHYVKIDYYDEIQNRDPFDNLL